MTFISYAQNFEDVYVWRAFRDVAHGFYVDLGAYDPDVDSVTRAFYERGWSGINVEPGPSFARFSKRERDINVKAAVSSRSGQIEFFLHPTDVGTSSIFTQIDERLKESVLEREPMIVTSLTLSEILSFSHGRHIHFLKIDIEGAEEEVIRSTDWRLNRPELLIVEATQPYSSERVDDRWADELNKADYIEVFFDGVNVYYLREESMSRKGAFDRPVNALDNFVKADPQRDWALLRVNDLESTYELMARETRGAHAAAQNALDKLKQANEAIRHLSSPDAKEDAAEPDVLSRDTRSQKAPRNPRVLVDGRVFSTSAFDRGMGRYVTFVIEELIASAHDVTLLVFQNCALSRDHTLFRNVSVRFAPYDPEVAPANMEAFTNDLHQFTAFLSEMVANEQIDIYIDATPFIPPCRLDLFTAVAAVCYDFIPLKHPSFYLIGSDIGSSIYYNGLKRVETADCVLAISNTVASEVTRYLGRPREVVKTLYPTIEERYLSAQPAPIASRYGFSIVGGHKSKNPARAIAILGQIAAGGRFEARINAPKPDQLAAILHGAPLPPRVQATTDIGDEEKFTSQRDAAFVAHLSIEEGFGIPLVEAIFLGKKVLALDIPMNRELLELGGEYADSAYLLPPDADHIAIDDFYHFLSLRTDDEYFQRSRTAFLAHWSDAKEILTDVVRIALEASVEWNSTARFKMFSSIPGEQCGVADYSVAYLRGSEASAALFFSHGDPRQIQHLAGTKVGSYRNFATSLPYTPALFNLAFSPALMPGVDLMVANAKPGDAVLVHERRYFEGLRHMLMAERREHDLAYLYAKAEQEEKQSALALQLAYLPQHNKRLPAYTRESPIDSAWLKALPSKLISHLPDSVMTEMRFYAESSGDMGASDLASLEGSMRYVPLGIDDRAHPTLRRRAAAFRRSMCLGPSDVIVGHFGLIVDDGKYLREQAEAVSQYIARSKVHSAITRRMFYLLSGKPLDQALNSYIQQCFEDAGCADRLLISNPEGESDFDAQIAATDAVFCFRRQNRGQVSHIYVRALSLGRPLFTNRRSGYAAGPGAVIDDDQLPARIADALDSVCFDTNIVGSLSRWARQRYELMHRVEDTLSRILDDEGGL